MVVDQLGCVHSIAQREFPQIFPNPGWVEHDAMEIWSSQIGSASEALAGANLSSEDIAAIGITNQRETTMIWDRKTGEPIHNAIVWQDRRTAEFCEALTRDGHAEMIAEKTGLQPDAYFSGSKIRWLLDNVPGARESAARGELAFGTMDSWLIWKLTNGKRHVTDVTNASRTMLFNLHTLQWDDELLKLLDIPRSLLPEVVASSGICAMTEGHTRWHSNRRNCGRPAGGALWTDVHRAGNGEVYLRHRLFHAAQYRGQAGAIQTQIAHDRCMGSRRKS